MGGCTSTKVKVIKPSDSASVSRSMSFNVSNMNSLAMKDIKGFKKSEHIDDFYDILEVIGRGN